MTGPGAATPAQAGPPLPPPLALTPPPAPLLPPPLPPSLPLPPPVPEPLARRASWAPVPQVNLLPPEILANRRFRRLQPAEA